MELTEFLLARIDDDEAAARAAAPAPWSYGGIESVAGGSLYDPGVMIASIHWDNPGDAPDPRIHRFRWEEQADKTGEHIARWDPARVLAECEAKRRIVEREESRLRTEWRRYRDEHRQSYEEWLRPPRGEVLRLLALPYADHEQFQQEWRP